MRHKSSKFQRNGKLSAKQKRLLPMVGVPLAVLILMAVIVFADGDKKDDPAAPAVAAEMQQAGARAAESQEAEAQNAGVQDAEVQSGGDDANAAVEAKVKSVIPENPLRQDGDPEILSLMQQYFKARATADAETMNSLYGIGEVDAATLEEEKTHMRSNSKYVQGFENITTYVKNGMTEDSWLVYAVTDIHFHAVKTPAPMIMWCYVTKDAEGKYLISDNATLSAEILQYIEVENRSEDVRRLASSVNVALKEALLSDEDLNEVYGVLREGSPVWQEEEETEAAEVQILDLEPADSVDEASTEADGTEEVSGTETSDGTDTESEAEQETMIDLTSGDICTDDFSGESTLLDDGSGQIPDDN